MDRLVRVRRLTPPGRPLRFHLLGHARLTGGAGGWRTSPRPRRTTATEWDQTPPYRMQMTVRTDGLDVAPNVNSVVEPKVAALRALTRPPRDGEDPPQVAVSGPIPSAAAAVRWVIQEMDVHGEIRRSDGQRVRCDIDLAFLEHVTGGLLVTPSPAARAQEQQEAPPSASTYTVKAGDTLSGIAAALLGDASRWREIADLNGIRDPRALQIGTELQIP